MAVTSGGGSGERGESGDVIGWGCEIRDVCGVVRV